jgi:TrmH family RNA methyltransferase
MPAAQIEKRTDPAVRFIRKVRDGEDRDRVFCEGLHLAEELLASHWPIQDVFCLPEIRERVREVLTHHGSAGTTVRTVAPHVMSFVSDLDTPPGVIAIARKRPPKSPAGKSAALVLVLAGVQNPQNVGAVLRTAEAAGVSEVWTTRATADPFGPKALRASSGSAFRLPVIPAPSLAEVAAQVKARDVRLVGATQNGAKDHDLYDWTGPAALVMGSEGTGFSKDELALFDDTVKIPMRGAVESLNVGSAAAICLFEAARQRRRKDRP